MNLYSFGSRRSRPRSGSSRSARAVPASNSHGLDSEANSARELSVGDESSAGDLEGLVGKAQWGSQVQYIFAAVGSAVGLGNLLRFPSLCYEYGGFAFLLPYALAVAFIGLPVLAGETMLGQMLQRSAVKAYATIHQRLWGLGAFLTWGALILVAYYNVIMAWSWMYLVYSFYSPLPWGTSASSAGAFFFEFILGMNDEAGTSWSLDDGLGGVSWHLLLAVLGQWVIVYLCIMQATATVQKVVLVTVPLPFLLLIVILIYGLTLEGSKEGIIAYVDPTNAPEKLLSWKAWVDAAAQIFFGLSLAVGVMIAYASHEPRRAKLVTNTWVIALVNSGTSILAGFAVFALLGHFSTSAGIPLDEVAISGFVLSFQTFPAAFAMFQGKGAPNVFSVLFFVTLLLLGLDSAMSLVEAISEAFIDNIPWCRKRIPFINALVCLLGFCFSLLMTTRGGYYVLDILDHFTANYVMLLGGAVATAVVGWGYPAEKLVGRIKKHTGQDARWLPFFWPWLCKVVTPLILAVLFAYEIYVDVSEPYGGYPQWALFAFGWLPGLIIPVLAFAVPSAFVDYVDLKDSPDDPLETDRAIEMPNAAADSPDEEECDA